MKNKPKRTRFGTLSGIGFLFAILTGCAPVDLLNATIPTGELKITRDIDYGADPHQRLDIYVPKSAAKNAPVIVFFYGGAWQSGDKGDYLFAAQALASGRFVAPETLRFLRFFVAGKRGFARARSLCVEEAD